MTDLSAADRRFFALRASGYRGPIDQDGYKVTDPEIVSILDALARIPSAHARAADEREAGGGTP